MKKYRQILCLMLGCCSLSSAAEHAWPVLSTYDQEHLAKIALPLGGIGTGTVSLGGRGNLQDWEVMNRPAKGYSPGDRAGSAAPFFALYVETDGSKTTRLLEGPVPLSSYDGAFGVSRISNPGLPRFKHAAFSAAYPFGQVHLSDPRVPVIVTVKAFNPMIPCQEAGNELPLAVLRFEISNSTSRPVTVAVCGSMQNFIGEDGSKGKASGNGNRFMNEGSLRGLFFQSTGVDSSSEQWGTMALASDTEGLCTHRTAWKRQDWGTSLLDFWSDLSDDGELEARPATGEDKPMASLAIKTSLAAGETRTLQFFIAWHFPNRLAWSETVVGNHYTTLYHDAWEVLGKNIRLLPAYEKDTIDFVSAVLNCDYPEVIKEAALFNLSTLRTQTCFRTRDGRYYAWEGCGDREGCCFGTCTHVWNYEQATAFLFGHIAESFRRTEFAGETDAGGLMSFRVHLPLEKARWGKAAADGQMGCIVKMYRDWQLSGDTALLRTLWPNVKRSLQFCWIKGGWDADKDGVMEGCQHNTMDVEYYGPNPQMQIWYLAALASAEKMADFMNDTAFSKDCRKLLEAGSRWTDAHLFNGRYYIHKIVPPMDSSRVAPSLRVGMGAKDLTHPDYQLGNGCLVDQLVGQFMAHVCGLGYLVKKEHVQTTLQSIMAYNYRPSLSDHFNCLRTFALGDEAALVMAGYPDEQPENPFPYFTEVMTGFEYTAAIGMLYENQIEDGLACMRNIRNRYDGAKRNPFDEAECGHHYGRAMISWAALPAWSGFHYSAVEKTLTLKAMDGRTFWSNGRAYGLVEQSGNDKERKVTVTVIKGRLSLRRLILQDFAASQWNDAQELTENESIQRVIRKK